MKIVGYQEGDFKDAEAIFEDEAPIQGGQLLWSREKMEEFVAKTPGRLTLFGQFRSHGIHSPHFMACAHANGVLGLGPIFFDGPRSEANRLLTSPSCFLKSLHDEWSCELLPAEDAIKWFYDPLKATRSIVIWESTFPHKIGNVVIYLIRVKRKR